MNTGDVIQIDAPDFDPDINGGLPTKEHEETQGSDSFIQHLSRESDKRKAPALPQQVAEEVDWPDAIPVEIPPQPDQDNVQNIPVLPIRRETNLSEIPQLESDIDEEEEGQFEDLQTYLTHHNTYQESQNIHKEYRKRLGPRRQKVLPGYRPHVRDLRPNSRPHTSQPNPRTSPYYAGAHTNIR